MKFLPAPGGALPWPPQGQARHSRRRPLTTAGWQRIRRWRREWLALPSPVIPALIGPDQVVRSGADGLRYLADLSTTGAALPPRPRAAARRSRWPLAA